MDKTALSLPAIFSKGLVLQRRRPIHIWGNGGEGDTVTVSLDGEGASTVVRGGVWALTLPPREAAPRCSLRVQSGGGEILIDDAAIGEVWIAGGQSNMEFLFKYDAERDRVMDGPPDPLLRFFDVPKTSYPGQEKDEDFSAQGLWRSWTREDAPYFSAVPYYFGALLRKHLDVPVALVGCNYGGTPAAAWMDAELLREDPGLSGYYREYAERIAAINLEKYAAKFKKIRKLLIIPASTWLVDEYMAGTLTIKKALPFLLRTPPWTLASAIAFAQKPGPFDAQRPGGLFAGMVKTIAGYSAQGVIWYQGENDAVHPQDYAALFSLVVQSWRRAWDAPLPFFTVMLAPYEKDFTGNSGKTYPELRQQQRIAAETLAGTYLICAMDAGERNNIHPRHKRPVGERLARAALGELYGLAVPHLAPQAVSVSKEDRAGGAVITIRFSGCYEGLSLVGETRDAGPYINGLELFAGNAGVRDFTVRLGKEDLVITAPAQTSEVRFAWLPYTRVNLCNSAGIPAMPFSLKV
jgi:sialate O-acetylesterase